MLGKTGLPATSVYDSDMNNTRMRTSVLIYVLLAPSPKQTIFSEWLALSKSCRKDAKSRSSRA